MLKNETKQNKKNIIPFHGCEAAHGYNRKVFIFFVSWETNFPKILGLNCVSSTFSYLDLTYLVIKVQKQRIRIC